MLHAMDLTSSTSRTDQINADLDTIQAAPQVRALAGCGGPGRSDPVSRKFEIRACSPRMSLMETMDKKNLPVVLAGQR